MEKLLFISNLQVGKRLPFPTYNKSAADYFENIYNKK